MRGMSTRVSVVADERYALPLGMTATKPNRHTHPRNDGIINFGSTLLPYGMQPLKTESEGKYIGIYHMVLLLRTIRKTNAEHHVSSLFLFVLISRVQQKPGQHSRRRQGVASASHVSALNDRW